MGVPVERPSDEDCSVVVSPTHDDEAVMYGATDSAVGICSQGLGGTASAVVRASRKVSYCSLVKGQLM